MINYAYYEQGKLDKGNKLWEKTFLYLCVQEIWNGDNPAVVL